jgi:hypothetical protein
MAFTSIHSTAKIKNKNLNLLQKSGMHSSHWFVLSDVG